VDKSLYKNAKEKYGDSDKISQLENKKASRSPQKFAEDERK